MSFEVLRQSVESQFVSNWTDTTLDKVDHGDNHDFTPPQNSEWVRIVTNVIGSENAQLGDDFQRITGIITVQCFVPSGTGEKAINSLVDSVKAIFQNKNFGGVRCFTTTPLRIGSVGNWYQINAKTDFQYDVFS